MKKIVSFLLIAILPLSTLPPAEANPIPTNLEPPILVATLSTISTGQYRLLQRMDRMSKNIMLHRFLQQHFYILNGEQAHVRTLHQQRVLERMQARIPKSVRIARNQTERQRRIPRNDRVTLHRSRRILREEVYARRGRERCQEDMDDSCSGGYAKGTPTPVALPSRSPSRLPQWTDRRIERLLRRQERAYASSHFKAVFPHSPRSLRESATQHNLTNEQRLDRIRARYTPPTPDGAS